MRVYSDGTCGCNIVINIGDEGVGVHDSYVCIYRELSLGMNINNSRTKNDRTHVEDEKDPVEVRPPGGDRLPIILRV